MLTTHIIRNHTSNADFVPTTLGDSPTTGVWKYVQGVRDQNVTAVGYKAGGAVFTMEVQGSLDEGVTWHVVGELASSDFDSGGGGWIEVPAFPLMRIKYAYTSGTNTSFDAWIIE